MKVLFVGPSLYGLAPRTHGIQVLPPAARGDIDAAATRGATMIGLVDGVFGGSASVWHKEILRTLSQGVSVLGAASMGALRAAECAAFGMIPVGRLAHAYLDGSLSDDAAVALTFLPQEAGYMPVTEPLVDSLATIERLARRNLVSPIEAQNLCQAASTLHFTTRTAGAIVDLAIEAQRRKTVLRRYRANWTSLKARDAVELVFHMRSARPPAPGLPIVPVEPIARWGWRA